MADLFGGTAPAASPSELSASAPLADRLRPARLEEVVAQSSQLLKDCGARNKEEQPPRDLCEGLQSLVSDMHRVLVEDTERTEEGKKAEWTPMEELAAPSDGSVDDPLLFLMKQAMDSLADSLHPHLRVLRTQLPLEEAIERNAKSAQAERDRLCGLSCHGRPRHRAAARALVGTEQRVVDGKRQPRAATAAAAAAVATATAGTCAIML